MANTDVVTLRRLETFLNCCDSRFLRQITEALVLQALNFQAGKGVANGIPYLDSSGKLPVSMVPGRAVEVVSCYVYNGGAYEDAQHTVPITAEESKLYIDKTTSRVYVYSGTTLVAPPDSIAIGTTSNSAFRGDLGQTAYDHATDSNKVSSASNSGLYKFAVTAQGHIASVTAVAKSDITGLGIASNSVATSSANGLMANADKSKLDAIASGAQVNVIETIKINGVAQTVTSKAVDLSIPGVTECSDAEIQALFN